MQHRDGARKGEEGDRPHGALLERVILNPELAKEVGLTEDQTKTLKAAMFKAREEEIKLRAEMELAGLRQANLMMKDDVDEDEVLKAVDEKWRIKAELAKIPIRQMLLVKKTLSAEQRTEIQKLVRRRMKERMSERQRDGEQDGDRERRPEGRFRGPMHDREREPHREPGERERDR